MSDEDEIEIEENETENDVIELSFEEIAVGIGSFLADGLKAFNDAFTQTFEGDLLDVADMVEYSLLYGRIEMLVKKTEGKEEMIPERTALETLHRYLMRFPKEGESIAKEVDKLEVMIQDKVDKR